MAEEVVRGAVDWARAHHDVDVILVGDEARIAPFIDEALPPHVTIVHATEAVDMDEAPAVAEDDLPPPAYRPQVAEFQPRAMDEYEDEAEAFVAPKAPAPGTPSPAAGCLRPAARRPGIGRPGAGGGIGSGSGTTPTPGPVTRIPRPAARCSGSGRPAAGTGSRAET